jgi:DNA repair protein RecN (Recombination protein N)
VLTHLRIRNFAILDDVELDLGGGLTVLTGETGAGKSLIAQAVALLRGGRASAEVIRGGADEAQVEALFELPAGGDLGAALAAAGIPRGDPAAGETPAAGRNGGRGGTGAGRASELLLVRRLVPRGGRSRVYLNGALATVAQLAQLVGGLIDLAGQHEHQRLCDVGTHLALLDAFADLEAEVAATTAAYQRLRDAAAALAAASGDERTRLEREDFLRFQVHELEQARLRPGEDLELERERDRLRAADRLQAAARSGEERLYAREGAVCDELAAVARELTPLAAIDPTLAPVAAELERARVTCEEAARELRRYGSRIEADPQRLAQVEDRLDLLGRLQRKHGATLDDVIRRHAEMVAELEERRAAAEAAVTEARTAAAQAATRLAAARRAAARDLAARATAALRELGMPRAEVALGVEARPATAADPPEVVFDGRRLGARGWDRAELVLAPNPGEEPRPLARIASGGELSRVMLGLRQVLCATDPVGTYVFDEVDAGIGGKVAQVVGRQLRRVARERQVLCITHLAPIAACADAHYLVEKHVVKGRTRTRVRALSPEERVTELGRMLGGEESTARAHAAQLLRGGRGRRG